MIRLCPRGHSIPIGQRCQLCERQRDQRRGTRQQRGYGKRQTQWRNHLRRTLPAPCGYGCGVTLYPNGDWVAAHLIDGDPDSERIAACRSCNETAKRRGLRP